MLRKKAFLVVMATVFTTILLMGSPGIAAAATIPDTLTAVNTQGRNLLGNAYFADVSTILPAGGGTGWYLDSSEGRTMEIDSVKVTDGVAGMAGITTAVKMTIAGNAEAGGQVATANRMIYGGMPALLEEGEVYYATAWVKTNTTIFFDVYSFGSNYYMDLGRRFEVAAEDGWVQIGLDSEGNFYPFRNHGGFTGWNFPSNTLSSSVAGRVDDESIGDVECPKNDQTSYGTFNIAPLTSELEGYSWTSFGTDAEILLTGVTLFKLGSEAPSAPVVTTQNIGYNLVNAVNLDISVDLSGLSAALTGNGITANDYTLLNNNTMLRIKPGYLSTLSVDTYSFDLITTAGTVSFDIEVTDDQGNLPTDRPADQQPMTEMGVSLLSNGEFLTTSGISRANQSGWFFAPQGGSVDAETLAAGQAIAIEDATDGMRGLNTAARHSEMQTRARARRT